MASGWHSTLSQLGALQYMNLGAFDNFPPSLEEMLAREADYTQDTDILYGWKIYIQLKYNYETFGLKKVDNRHHKVMVRKLSLTSLKYK